MSKRAEELANKLYPDPKIEDYDDILVYRADRDNAIMGRANAICIYEQAEKDTIERACQLLYDYNKQMTKMFGAKAVLSCNQFTIDVERFRKTLIIEEE